MADTLRIEIPIDEKETELTNLIEKIGKLGKEAEKAGVKVKKSTEYVMAFERQAEKTEKSLRSWAKEKYEILLEAKEKITPVLSALGTGLKNFAGKAWKITIGVVDLATAPIRGVINLLKDQTFQVGETLGISIGLADAIETYKNFEAAMTQVQVISGSTAAELAQLAAKARDMKMTIKFSAEECAQAFQYMAMAGWKAGDMLGGIEGILDLAAASGQDLAAIFDLITAVLTAFGLKAADAGHFADVLAAAAAITNTAVSDMGETLKCAAAMAGILGYSLEDVSLMAGLLTDANAESTMLGTVLDALFTRISANAGGAADAMKKLNVDFFDQDGNARDLSDVIEELRLATADMNEEQKSNIANTIAGTQAQEGLRAILTASEEEYQKLSETISNADGAAARLSGTVTDNLQGAIEQMQNSLGRVKISFGERLSPYVRGLADWIAGQMPALEQGLNEFMDWVDKKVDRIQRRYAEFSGTQEQDAGFFEKVRIAWDEFIADPFVEWWYSTGKARFAGFAKDIGAGIGTGLKTGIMALLGIDLGETENEAASIAASFAKGFSEGFDFEAIWGKLWSGFGNLLSSAGKFLPGGEAPGLSSVFSLMLLSKIASPVIGVGKGAFGVGKALFGASGSLAPLVSAAIGAPGNAMVRGSGILGGLANVGYGLSGGGSSAGMYFGSLDGTMSGGTAALLGAGSVAGGVIGAAGLVHGIKDLYTGFTSDDPELAKAYKTAGAVEVGGTLAGAGAGAAAGAAIGALFGGVGAVPGALIGAGVGAIGSWIAGNKIKEEYEENLEQMQRKAENAQKAFAVTGISIDEIKFKNEALTEAMHDAEVSAEDFALMLQEGCADVAKKAFGDITLSLAEVKKLAGEITLGDMAEEMEEYTRAAAGAEASLSALVSISSDLKKENWKVSLGMKLSETDKDRYKSTIENFIIASQNYIDDNHYEAVAALKLLAGDDADTTGMDSYYTSLSEQMEDLKSRLQESLNMALEDDVITPDESAILKNLQDQITSITDKLADAQADARMQTLKVKYSGAKLDMETFNLLQEELIANAETETRQYEDALTQTLTVLNLRRDNGDIDDEEYNREKTAAEEMYLARINASSARMSSFSLETIADAWNNQLDGILPEIEGSTAEKLEHAMNNALILNPDVMSWTQEEVKRWFGLDSLVESEGEAFKIIYEQLKKTALAVPTRTKKDIIDTFGRDLPTVEEIMAAVDFTSMNWGDYISITGGDVTRAGRQHVKLSERLLTGEEENYEELCRNFAENIRLYMDLDSEETIKLLDTCMREKVDWMALFGPISNERYEEIREQWEATGTAYADALTAGASTSLRSGSSLLRNDLQTALDNATASSFLVSPKINLTPSFRGTVFTSTQAGQHAYCGF